MKRWAIVVIVVVLAVTGAVAWWLISSRSRQDNNAASTPSVTDMTQASKVDVSIRDLSFTPAAIKIKKGTTVTWTNQDTVAHDVVGDDPVNNSWFKTSAHTFTKDQTYSVTFNTVGTFTYHCTVHPFMKGSVQVVE